MIGNVDPAGSHTFAPFSPFVAVEHGSLRVRMLVLAPGLDGASLRVNGLMVPATSRTLRGTMFAGLPARLAID